MPDRYLRPCPLARGGTLEVEVLGPGARPATVRVRATNLRWGEATWEIREERLRRLYVRGRVLPVEKLFGGRRRA